MSPAAPPALPDLAAEALAQWRGTGVPRLIAERENVVFEVALPGGRAALRLHRRGYQTEDAIRSELWWMEALAEAGQPVPRPQRTPAGELLVRLSDGRLASVMAWADGAPLGAAGRLLAGDAAQQVAVHRALGEVLGALHVATDRLTLPPAFQRPRWDTEGLLGAAPFWGRFWEHPALTPGEAGLLQEIRADLQRRLLAHAAAGADQGLIHADVLRENVLCCAGAGGLRLTLIDFDDCGHGFRLYDLGTALSQNVDEPQFRAIAGALLEGYSRHRPLGRAEQQMVADFTLMRALASVGWTMPRLPPADPRHRAYIDRALRLIRRRTDTDPADF